MNPQTPRLDNQLCFQFYRIERALMKRYRPVLASMGLTYLQYLSMLALWEKGSLSVGELCLMLELDTGTVSPLLKRMEKSGLVSRTRDSGDEREVKIGLTEKGRALEAEAAAVPARVFACFMTGNIDYAALQAELALILGTLQEANSGSTLYS